MSTATALAATTPTAITAPPPNAGRELSFYGMDREQIDLLKRTIAKGTTDDQLALFLVTAKRLGLDPFARQIYAVLRAVKGGNGYEMAIQTGIDGFRAIAMRTGECDGQDGPFWCGEDGVWRDCWISNEPPVAAKVLVYRKGASRPFTGIAHLKSYAAYGDKALLINQWAVRAEHMLAKCAEALALRKAFPIELGGVYTEDELDRDKVIDVVPLAERLPVVPVKADDPPQADPWEAFLVDLAPLAAVWVEAYGTPAAAWTEEEIYAAWAQMLADAESVREVNAAVGPWSIVINKHARASTRVAAVKAAIEAPYKARTAKLREEAAAAKKGGAS